LVVWKIVCIFAETLKQTAMAKITKKLKELKVGGIILFPAPHPTGGREGTINLSYDEMKSILGMPNLTRMDDPGKVKASWGFIDQSRWNAVYAWCYKYSRASDCHNWSCAGNVELLKELFGKNYL
jgi:hypothetical protein